MFTIFAKQNNKAMKNTNTINAAQMFNSIDFTGTVCVYNGKAITYRQLNIMKEYLLSKVYSNLDGMNNTEIVEKFGAAYRAGF